ncbi:hypothetical protein [Rhabdochromatium marinum]|uniref:hypothetical protein n=1 Tax=Rhabdochromatium marinum TaxID=48729 RepID=UPI0019063DE6|nr:hypothetical protein [Rhabdochromatium marinum]MBK1647078.1 hypothetical protein [Rhabdochromatium marinum]
MAPKLSFPPGKLLALGTLRLDLLGGQNITHVAIHQISQGMAFGLGGLEVVATALNIGFGLFCPLASIGQSSLLWLSAPQAQKRA